MDVVELLNRSENLISNFSADEFDQLNKLFNKAQNIINQVEINIYAYKIGNKKPPVKHNKQIDRKKLILAKSVSSFNDIPSVPLYYVRNNDTYAININNCLIYGNINNLSNDTNHGRYKPCNRGISCDLKNCTFYHDPKIIPWSKDYLSFQDITWKYTDQLTCAKNKMMRHVGSEPIAECRKVDTFEFNRWNGQTMFNLLITLLINQHHT